MSNTLHLQKIIFVIVDISRVCRALPVVAGSLPLATVNSSPRTCSRLTIIIIITPTITSSSTFRTMAAARRLTASESTARRPAVVRPPPAARPGRPSRGQRQRDAAKSLNPHLMMMATKMTTTKTCRLNRKS